MFLPDYNNRGLGSNGTITTVYGLNRMVKIFQISRLLTNDQTVVKKSIVNLAIVKKAAKNGNQRCKLAG
ncbi:hypothetical protein DN310_26120 [Salmonella enterica subsp. salamae]|uniref:Uncharacterized protein n=1 Tax=Salmonella enterica subsp. salamae TaxID=59202 RepID=A0A5Y3MZE2_SALER|nr:hypothetical protein [Salmonella enterica subsp. salamae]